MYGRTKHGHIKIFRKQSTERLVCAFTGHRPSKLGGYNWNSPVNKIIMNRLMIAILKLIKSSNAEEFLFIVGGAQGIDQMAFEALIRIRDSLSYRYIIKIQMAIPFEDQPVKWFDSKDQIRYKRHLKLADELVYVDHIDEYNKYKHIPIGRYHISKLSSRNQYMVDQSNYLIAIWDGSLKGGTADCVRRALKKKAMQVIIVDPMVKLLAA
jgi:uncharacterized phage-like protein YoqJ